MTSLRSGVKITLMKKLSTYLFLILFSFSAPSFADDISDFQIEGISIGDSALEYLSLEEIQKEIEKSKIRYAHKKNSYKFGEVELENKKFTISEYIKFFELYDALGFSYKTDDKKYIVQGIQGQIDFNEKTFSDHSFGFVLGQC